MSSFNILPNDIFSLKGNAFYKLVQTQCGDEVMELVRYQCVSSAYSLLYSPSDLFDCIHLNSSDPRLIDMKQKVAFLMDDGTWKIKIGIQDQVDSFMIALRARLWNDQQPVPPPAEDLVISADLLSSFPWLKSLVLFCQNLTRSSNTSKLVCLSSFVENLAKNLLNPSNRYRHSKLIEDFALAFLVTGGHYAYQFFRLNIPGSLPCPTSISSRLMNTNHRLIESEFRFDLMKEHFRSIDVKYIYASEDCTGVIKKISYDAKSNSFVGFPPPLNRNGMPQQLQYQTDSFNELRKWFNEKTPSNLLNIHVAQPISVNDHHDSPYLISAYGTDNKFDMSHVLLRWLHLIEECGKRGIRIIGFSTDCDIRYLRAMRLITRFFASLPNIPIRDDLNSFRVILPSKWIWFFMDPKQICLVFSRR